MTTGKTIALTRWTFVGKVISLILNMLSRLVITFLPRSEREVTQSCLTLCDPWSVAYQAPPHGIFKARILEWVTISFSRRSSWPRNWTLVSSLAGRFFTTAPPFICYCYRFRWNLHGSWLHLEDWKWVSKCLEYVDGIWLQNGTG